MCERHLVFSYGDDEHVPIYTCLGSKLKTKNVCKSISTVVETTESFRVVEKKTKFNNKEIIVRIKYNIENDYCDFSNGTIQINKLEYPVILCKTFSSLQIEDWCYDNIDVVRVPSNIF